MVLHLYQGPVMGQELFFERCIKTYHSCSQVSMRLCCASPTELDNSSTRHPRIFQVVRPKWQVIYTIASYSHIALSNSGPYSKQASFCIICFMGWRNILRCGIGYFPNPKRPTIHLVSFLVVESASCNNWSFTLLWREWPVALDPGFLNILLMFGSLNLYRVNYLSCREHVSYQGL